MYLYQAGTARSAVPACLSVLLTLPAQYVEQDLYNGRAFARPSVCLSRRSTAAAARGRFAADRHAGRRNRSKVVGTAFF